MKYMIIWRKSDLLGKNHNSFKWSKSLFKPIDRPGVTSNGIFESWMNYCSALTKVCCGNQFKRRKIFREVNVGINCHKLPFRVCGSFRAGKIAGFSVLWERRFERLLCHSSWTILLWHTVTWRPFTNPAIFYFFCLLTRTDVVNKSADLIGGKSVSPHGVSCLKWIPYRSQCRSSWSPKDSPRILVMRCQGNRLLSTPESSRMVQTPPCEYWQVVPRRSGCSLELRW